MKEGGVQPASLQSDRITERYRSATETVLF